MLDWQKRTIETARKTGATRTLMNRYRRLHGINSAKAYLRSGAARQPEPEPEPEPEP